MSGEVRVGLHERPAPDQVEDRLALALYRELALVVGERGALDGFMVVAISRLIAERGPRGPAEALRRNAAALERGYE